MSKFSRHNSKASKVTAGQVMEMREKYTAGATQRELCQEYNLSVVQVGRIVRGESWRRLPATMPTGDQNDLMLQKVIESARHAQEFGPERAPWQEPERVPVEPAMPLPAEVLRKRDILLGRLLMDSPPPSPLEGGDAPDATDGSGVERLVKEVEVSVASDKLLDELKGEKDE